MVECCHCKQPLKPDESYVCESFCGVWLSPEMDYMGEDDE